MEGGSAGVGVGPPTSNSHSRPIRASSSRYLYGGGHPSSSSTTFFGPVRRWQKKWVHVSSSSSSKPRKQSSNAPKSPTSPLLLCRWTPLSADGHDIPRRKFRYTPIAVFEEQKKWAAKRVAGKGKSGETHQSVKMPAIDSDGIYGMLDINNDLVEAHQETSESDLISQHSRSPLNPGLNLENKNENSQSDVNLSRMWATN